MKRVLSSWRKNIFNHPYTLRNSVEWIQSGKKYYDRLEELIDLSRFEIHLQTYIFISDETGNRIAEALIRAAKRNIRIFLLLDAYGSQGLSSAMIHRFKETGINFKKYGEIFSKGRFHIGRRMHHKIIVIDGQISVVGGINVSDNYNDTPDSPAWLDFAVIMEGDISRRLQYICRRRWIGWHFSYMSKKDLLINTQSEKINSGYFPIRIRRNDFIRYRNDIAISYREAFRRSEKSIILVGGYFLPGGRTRRLMRKATLRGVKISVIVSEKSDVKILVNARRYLYAWLIRNKIDVYEYKLSNVHGKVIIVDETWTSIGSFDLNNLSTYSNIELNVDINEPNFSADLAKHIQKIMAADCIKLDNNKVLMKKTFLYKFAMWFSYRFVKTLFVLSVLLAGRKEKEF